MGNNNVKQTSNPAAPVSDLVSVTKDKQSSFAKNNTTLSLVGAREQLLASQKSLLIHITEAEQGYHNLLRCYKEKTDKLLDCHKEVGAYAEKVSKFKRATARNIV